MTEPAPIGYARRLGVFDATMLVIGGIIGAGIFLNPSVVARHVPSAALALGVWVLGGLVALAGAFVFAELAALKPDAGGGYIYLRDGLGPLVGFLYGWTELLVINSGGIAAVGVTFASYAARLTGAPDPMITPLAVGAIVLLSAVNLLGIKPGAVVQNVLTLLKLAALAALIIVGLSFSASETPAASAAATAAATPLITAIGIALIPVLFTYGGWQSTNFVAGELRQPRRDLPRALLLGVVVVVIVYLLANAVYLKVLGLGGLATSTAPASDVMTRLLGPAGGKLIAIGIAVSTFGFLNLAILSAPRMYQAMANDGVFFGPAAKLGERTRVPTAALLLQSAWAILLVATKSYDRLLEYVVFGDWIFFAAVGVTLFIYRRRPAPESGDIARFRAPLYPWLPGFFVLAGVFAVVSTVASNPINAALGGAIIAAGIPAYQYWKRTSQHPTERQS